MPSLAPSFIEFPAFDLSVSQLNLQEAVSLAVYAARQMEADFLARYPLDHRVSSALSLASLSLSYADLDLANSADILAWQALESARDHRNSQAAIAASAACKTLAAAAREDLALARMMAYNTCLTVAMQSAHNPYTDASLPLNLENCDSYLSDFTAYIILVLLDREAPSL